MTTHTQGRLVVGTVAKLTICDAAGKFLPVARVTTPNGGGAEVRAEARENARRLVACWNACEGISTDDLEHISGNGGMHGPSEDIELISAERDALLKALQNYVTCIATAGGGDKQLFMAAIRDADNKAREVIAKATGEAI